METRSKSRSRCAQHALHMREKRKSTEYREKEHKYQRFRNLQKKEEDEKSLRSLSVLSQKLRSTVEKLEKTEQILAEEQQKSTMCTQLCINIQNLFDVMPPLSPLRRPLLSYLCHNIPTRVSNLILCFINIFVVVFDRIVLCLALYHFLGPK